MATPVASIEEAFHLLDKMLKKQPADARNRVAAHIRAATGKPLITLSLYHQSNEYNEAQKLKVYQECALAVVTNNYSQLKTAAVPVTIDVAPAKRVDPCDDTPAVAPARPVAALEVAEAPVTPRFEVPAAPSQPDSLSAVIARAIEPLMKVQAGADEAKIAELVKTALDAYDKGFHDKVKAALGNGSFPEDRVKKLIAEAGGGARIEFTTPGGEVKAITGLMHPQVPQIAAWLRAGVPVWGFGAAGSGKTHMARQIAAMLDVQPFIMSVDPTMTVSKIMGYRNVANGEFVPGFSYLPYKDGGLLAADEKDTGDAGVMAAANAMLSNGHYLFPNGETVTRNAKFHYLALANTKGMGAVAGYVARNRLDAATLDRFAVIEIKYDKGLESALACGVGKAGEPWKPGKPASQATQLAYVNWVQKVREFVKDSVLVSPRASINGCKALRCGIPLAEVVEALVFKLVASDSRQRIVDACQLPQEVK